MTTTTDSSHALPFIVVWEFRVRPGRRRAFEKAYGPDGPWVRLFARTRGHLRSELIRDPEKPLRFLALEVWRSRRAYEHFMRQNQAGYDRIDRRCSWLTLEEKKLIGKFDTVTPLGGGTSPGHAPLEIRPASQADVRGMISLERGTAAAAHWPENAYQKIFDRSPPRLAFTLHGQDRTVEGFVVASLSGQDCELENIVVAPCFRSLGWGRRLLRALIAAARSRNAQGIFLEVRESASSARGLYETCGFVRAGRRPGYYRNPTEDAILYRLEL